MKRLAILSAVLVVSITACSDDTPTTPTTTPTVTVTDVFPTSDAGTISVNGAVTHDFSAKAGDVVVVLSSFGPDSTANVGLALGTWNGTGCQLIITNDTARQGSTITGRATDTGGLCVRIYDAGKLTEPVAYRISVTHQS